MRQAGSRELPSSSSSPTYPTLSCSTTPVTLQQSFGTYLLSLIFFHVCHLLPRDILSLSNSLPLIGTGPARAPFPSPGDLPSFSRRDVTTRRAHSSPFQKCVHRAMIPPLSSSLGSYHNVECASECLSRESSDEPPFPCLGQTVADLSDSEPFCPMGPRNAPLSSQWLCVFRVRRWRAMRRLSTLRAAERNVPRYCTLISRCRVL